MPLCYLQYTIKVPRCHTQWMGLGHDLFDPSARRMFVGIDIVERGTHVVLPTRQSYHYQQGNQRHPTGSIEQRESQADYHTNRQREKNATRYTKHPDKLPTQHLKQTT